MSAANHTTDENFKIVVAPCVARVLASIYIYTYVYIKFDMI